MTSSTPRTARRTRSPFAIHEAVSPSQVEVARSLFREYRAWLVDHREVTAFGDEILARGLTWLDQEIEELPGDYIPPGGALLVAYSGITPVGCAALHGRGLGVGEIKRIYVRESQRGAGLGRRLTRQALSLARKRGYRRVVLDTLPTMNHAIAMYRKMGFQPTERYWPHPVPDALFFEFRLDPPSPRRTPRRAKS